MAGVFLDDHGEMICRVIGGISFLRGGDLDKNNPLPGLEECVAAAQKAYAAADAPNHFAVIIQKNTGHQVRPDSERAAIDWFVKWLKP